MTPPRPVAPPPKGAIERRIRRREPDPYRYDLGAVVWAWVAGVLLGGVGMWVLGLMGVGA